MSTNNKKKLIDLLDKLYGEVTTEPEPRELTLVRLRTIRMCEELIQFNAIFDQIEAAAGTNDLGYGVEEKNGLEPAPAPTPEPTPAPAPAPAAPAKKELTLDDLRKTITGLCAEHPGLDIPSILADFGCKRLSDVPAERYAEFAERAKALAEGGN